jgi:apolipoprotein N-acyltransferase
MHFPMIAHGPSWRVVRAILVGLSRTSPLVIAAGVLFPELWPWAANLDNPLRLARVFLAFCAAPGLAAWLIGRVFAGTFTVRDGTLILERLNERVEIPCSSIRRLAAWTVPLPGGGVSLQLGSGRWFRWGLQLDDPPALAAALADGGATDDVRRGGATAAAVYAGSTSIARTWIDHPAFKFVAFALVPAIPVFRLHQWVAYGGTFGEYYIYGLRAYVLAFAIYWVWAIVHLVLFAAVVRAVLEPIVMVSAWVAPARTHAVRRLVEAAARFFFYGGVLAFLGRLYLQSLGG